MEKAGPFLFEGADGIGIKEETQCLNRYQKL